MIGKVQQELSDNFIHTGKIDRHTNGQQIDNTQMNANMQIYKEPYEALDLKAILFIKQFCSDKWLLTGKIQKVTTCLEIFPDQKLL